MTLLECKNLAKEERVQLVVCSVKDMIIYNHIRSVKTRTPVPMSRLVPIHICSVRICETEVEGDL